MHAAHRRPSRSGAGASCALLVALALLAATGRAATPATPVPSTAPTAAAVAQAGPAGATPGRAKLDVAVGTRPWKGDLGAMEKRRIIRALVPPSKTFYYVEQGRPRGISYDVFKAFEDDLNRQLKTKTLKVTVVFLPVARDEIIQQLNDGRGDVAFADMVATPEREKVVAFSTPLFSGIQEVVVTGPGTEPVASAEALSGKKVYVRPSSSYHEHLVALNARLAAAGKPPVTIVGLPEELEAEDVLEMVNAGLIPITVVDRYKALMWRRVFTSIRFDNAAIVHDGGDNGFMLRKDTPELKAALDRFVATHKQGTAFGNTVVNRYVRDPKFVKNALGDDEQRRFGQVIQLFRKYGAQYDMDYLLMVAQGFQESQLDQGGKSHVGAIGVMQIMPQTGKDLGVGDIHVTENNVNGGIKYMRWMIDHYYATEPMTPLNKALFAFASYNAGPARIASLRREAAKRGLDPNRWFNNVELVAADKIGPETVTYVSNIYKYYTAYQLLMQQDADLRKAKTGLRDAAAAAPPAGNGSASAKHGRRRTRRVARLPQRSPRASRRGGTLALARPPMRRRPPHAMARTTPPARNPRQNPTTLAVVDMGSNSFRMEVGRVEGRQIFPLDTWRETLRMGGSLDAKGRINPAAQRAALACLARFGERLRGLHPCRARGGDQYVPRRDQRLGVLAKAEKALGFRIDVISGVEEARLIYMGVAHLLPDHEETRLVIDIGGGSTEFIIGRGLDAQKLESLRLGCVSCSQRFFGNGKLTAAAFITAETYAAAEIEPIAREFASKHWSAAYASSGTALALAAILEGNGLSAGGITPDGLRELRARMIRAGHIDRLELVGLKDDRRPVLAGGTAIMTAALAVLGGKRIDPVGGALRLGVMVDMLGRAEARDVRVTTIEQFMQRYRVDEEHARRVAELAEALYRRAVARPTAESLARLRWAALLHEIGLTVAHESFHRHGAYILEHADMPGFAARDQKALALLVLACRGKLAKVAPLVADPDWRAQILALRLAVLFHHARSPVKMPRLVLRARPHIAVRLPAAWLKRHPLTSWLLAQEREQWRRAGHAWSGA